MHPQRITNIPVVPVVLSPDCANISGKDELTKTSTSNKKKTAAGRNRMAKMQKHQKTVVKLSAKNNLFQFICPQTIKKLQEQHMDLNSMSYFETTIRSTNNHWSSNSRDKLQFQLFDTLESKLMTSSQHPFSHAYHCLLLEEMMLLKEDSKCTCMVSSEHYFLEQNQSKSLIKKCLEKAPICSLILDRKVFFAFNLTLILNPKLERVCIWYNG